MPTASANFEGGAVKKSLAYSQGILRMQRNSPFSIDDI